MLRICDISLSGRTIGYARFEHHRAKTTPGDAGVAATATARVGPPNGVLEPVAGRLSVQIQTPLLFDRCLATGMV